MGMGTVGLAAGWLSGQFMRGSYGLVGDIVLGIIGPSSPRTLVA
jgi:uncharacterized membrane protein YeaQ/YmgE (transglycosylase-associated protein family)